MVWDIQFITKSNSSYNVKINNKGEASWLKIKQGVDT